MMKHSLRSTIGIAAFALGGLLVLHTGMPHAQSSPMPYVLTDLGTLGGLSAEAFDINDAGEIVGAAMTTANQSRAFLWRNGTMTDLGTLGGLHSSALAISPNRHITGRSQALTSKYHAALWTGGAISDLTPSSDYAVGNGVNSSAKVVGTINNLKGFVSHNGILTELDGLGGECSNATDINDTDHIVGSSCSTIVTAQGVMPHATLWHNGAIIDLGVVPGADDSGATAINTVGQIVGSSGRTDPDTYEVTSYAFLYENGSMTVLPVPSTEAYAGDINDSGIVVGTMRAGGGFSNYHAYIYANGIVTNLNSLIPSGSGLHLAYGTAVNNSGQIVGTAFDAQGRSHAYLLTPLAPGTAMVNIGDALVTEGNDATRTVNVTVALSVAASEPISVAFNTANRAATAGSDYQAASGVVTFDPGETTETISVTVNGDRTGESNETFVINLSNVQGAAVIGDGLAVVTIADDEPRIRINDVSKNEGNNGTTSFVFTVSTSPASDANITVNYATANGWSSTDDYTPTSGTLAFSAGQTSKTLTVAVKGDKVRESEETFYVNLSGAVEAFIADAQGTGVIRNDDR